MTQLFALLGMALGLVKDIARANYEDEEFDWMAWLGERPLQVITRLLLVVVVLTPKATELAQEAMSGVDVAGAPTLIQVLVPTLIGLYGDKIGKRLLEHTEDVSQAIPLVKKLFTWGKRLT